MADISETNVPLSNEVDALVVGAGFGGLYMLHRLRKAGFVVKAVETGGDVGGTWFWNRYPGARCDIESFDYSYSFDPEIEQAWDWTERYAAQSEILSYIRFVADRLELRPDITFNTRVVSANYDEAAKRWTAVADSGAVWSCRFLILATGALSAAKALDIAGVDDFQGLKLLTSSWPAEDVDLTGKRVAVIGTGSSGIQSIPKIAAQAAHLYVLQRTPAFSVPAHNAPLTAQAIAGMKENYPVHREKARRSRRGVVVRSSGKRALEVTEDERREIYEEYWRTGGFHFTSSFTDLLVSQASNDTAARFVHGKIREIVKDPAVAESLCPADYPLGTKRLCLDTDYYQTYNRNNVTLVDLRKEELRRITRQGIQTSQRQLGLDAIVFATGFDAMTGSMLRIDIRGSGGATLRDRWSHGPRTYLGLMVAGFPNLFVIAGPGSPSVFSNMVMAIEQQIDWLTPLLEQMRAEKCAQIEADPEAEDRWLETVNEAAKPTLFMKASSWYLGANVSGKARVFMPFAGGLKVYRDICDTVAARDYEGFVRTVLSD
jgi:cyclohexanone monooxygenase